MPSKILSAATVGLDSSPVDVEVDVLSAGLHAFTIVGLPDTAIKESRERVSSALKNSGFRPPHQCGRITVNLAPADLPKASPIYDLPIALGFLRATEQVTFGNMLKIFIGELALDGSVRAVTGVLPIALFAKKHGFTELYVPADNAKEAAVVQGITVIPVRSLRGAVEHLTGATQIAPQKPTVFRAAALSENTLDMCHIKGQHQAKRALEIAAAGGHNVFFNGPPGSGKTLLARTFVSILPRLTLPESLEITKIYSIGGNLAKACALVTDRPFRTPHHSASAVSLIGGGAHPRPGEISLAHRGVLFLDEFAEFPRGVLENLRQPLEDGIVTISRARGSLQFPAHFTLIAAMNPCPCGNATDPEKLCSCAPAQIIKYQQKISGPIMDRIDLHVEVPRVSIKRLEDDTEGESSAEIRARVQKACKIQEERFADLSLVTNAEMGMRDIKKFCALDAHCKTLLREAVTSLHVSTRVYYRLIKIARTIADLDGSAEICTRHIAEAMQYRFKTE